MEHVSIFSRIIDIFFPPTEDERIVRSLTERDVAALYSPQRIRNGHALTRFRDTRIRALIHRAKYARDTHALSHLDTLLHRTLATLPEPSIIVPIPLAPGRLRERGYNQCTEIARMTLAGSAHTLNESILIRVRETPPQTHLTRSARLTNMTGAFAVQENFLDPVRDSPLIILDDVSTTGTTLDEAYRTLVRAGATRVSVIALSN